MITLLVKCRICGNKIDKKEAYKVVINDKNHYYCSESEYENYKKEQDNQSKIIEMINEIFGHVVHSTALYKEIQKAKKCYGSGKILNYLIQNKDKLTYIISGKNFANEYNAIRYLFAILHNNMPWYKYTEEIRKTVEADTTQSKYRPQKKRKALIDFE